MALIKKHWEGAAYTVQARKCANGEIEIDLRRGAGAKLGKTLSVGWTGDLNNGRIFLGGRGGVIIQD